MGAALALGKVTCRLKAWFCGGRVQLFSGREARNLCHHNPNSGQESTSNIRSM
jgi:hypothetical protein